MSKGRERTLGQRLGRLVTVGGKHASGGPFDKLRERKAGPFDGLRERNGGLDLTPPVRYDPVAARPKVVLHYHLSDAIFWTGQPEDGLVRPDNGDDLLTVHQLVEFLTDTGCPVRSCPWSIPTRCRRSTGMRSRNGSATPSATATSLRCFPYGTCTSATMDLDHTLAYQHDGGPPGQTSVDNLGPLARPSHRAATHGGWQKRQPVPGTYLWRSPTGWIYLVTNHGTLNLGRTAYAHALWQTTLSYTDAQAEPQSA